MTGGSAGTVITGALIMAALVYKAADLVKYVIALFGARGVAQEGDNANKTARREALNGLLTLVLGGVVGIGVIMLMVHTSWSNDIKIGTGTLQSLSVVEQIVLGLVITSLAAVLFDFKKAIDRTDTASTPKLLAGPDRARREQVAATASAPKRVRDDSRSPKVLEEAEDFVHDTRAFHDDVEEKAKHLGDVLAGHHPTTDGGPRS